MEKHNVLLKGALRISTVIATKLDPSDTKDREKLEEMFTKQLEELGKGLATDHTMVRVTRYDTSVEELSKLIA